MNLGNQSLCAWQHFQSLVTDVQQLSALAGEVLKYFQTRLAGLSGSLHWAATDWQEGDDQPMWTTLQAHCHYVKPEPM